MAAAAATADTATRRAASVEHAASRINMVQLIQLRWIAVVGQITTIAFVNVGLRIPLPTAQMLMVLACLVAFNLASQLRWQEGSPVSNRELFLALLVDVASLTALLYFSGGAIQSVRLPLPAAGDPERAAAGSLVDLDHRRASPAPAWRDCRYGPGR